MHVAKGLEFRAVVVMGCDQDVLPLGSRIAEAADEGELDDIYETERQLLYVACTRARDRLLVTGVAPGSEFLKDLGPSADALSIAIQERVGGKSQ
jgi:superfamily I DNA/RNA helicase